tara:strand:- start:2757 stop:3227 length:471 start_codon:yes stop_codon:yes gene_type:complete
MKKKAAQLSDRQESFIYNLVCLGNKPTQAARLAGYATPKTTAHELTKNPKIIVKIQQMRSKLFSSDLATTACEVLRDVMLNSSTDSARVSACRTVLELSGDFARSKATATDKELAELTPEELGSMIESWEQERKRVTGGAGQGAVKIIEGQAINKV